MNPFAQGATITARRNHPPSPAFGRGELALPKVLHGSARKKKPTGTHKPQRTTSPMVALVNESRSARLVRGCIHQHRSVMRRGERGGRARQPARPLAVSRQQSEDRCRPSPWGWLVSGFNPVFLCALDEALHVSTL